MPRDKKGFFDFWIEIRKYMLLAYLRIVIFFPAVALFVVVFIKLYRCEYSNDPNPLRLINCGEVYSFSSVMSDVKNLYPAFLKMTILIGLPISFIQILYLEWEKYKQGKPPSFGVYGMRTTPNGGWMRSNFERLLSGQAWEKFDHLKLDHISDSENHLTGSFSNEEVIKMVKSVSRRFTSFLRKPMVETADCIEWHIHARSGEELKLKLERTPDNLGSDWILTACLFEWIGRNQPVRLLKTHSTRFLVTSNAASAPEGMDSAAGGLN